MRDPDGMIVLASDKHHRIVRSGPKITIEVEADKIADGSFSGRWENANVTKASARKFLRDNMPGYVLDSFDGWTHYRRYDGRSASARVWIVVWP